jgi:DNA-binding IclR family transcriptional regulator
VSADEELLGFIGSSFRSVWALELLLLLKRERRTWAKSELVATLRASDLVVSKALDSLVAAGLASVDDEGAAYMPVSGEVAMRIDEAEQLYLTRPNAVRRAIVSAETSSATAFANAFRLKKD